MIGSMLSSKYSAASFLVYMLITTLFSISDETARDVRLRLVVSAFVYVVGMYVLSS